MTGILSQYLMRTILASTALVLVVLLALAGLFEFIAELEDVKGDYKTPQAILFAALRLPNLAFQMFPVSALIGSLLGLGGLAANSEVIVMRASGMSVGKLAGMVGFAGFVMLVITALVGTKGLGQSIYIALGKADSGAGIVAGLGMALIAMIADRIIQSWSNRKKAALGLAT